MTYTDVVVDLETLGTDSNSVIVSIGAVAFNPADQDSYDTLDGDRAFYAVLDRQLQINAGAKVDASTIDWWMQQSKLAQQVFSEPDHIPHHALADFSDWCCDMGARYLWGNGATFDNVILQNAFQRHSVKWPFRYSGDMDMRTLVRLAGSMKGFSMDRGIAHHALDDAKYEALKIQAAWRLINGKEAGSDIRQFSSQASI